MRRIFFVLLILTLFLCGCDVLEELITVDIYMDEEQSSDLDELPMDDPPVNIHFIDVGQGDGALIEYPGGAILIDAGERNSGVLDYLKSVGIDRLDYVIGTHPHSDHIGGLAEVIDALPVDNLFMPQASSNTRTYENLLIAVQKNNLKIKSPSPGDTIRIPIEQSDGSFQDELIMYFVAPNSGSYEKTNNYSIVFKLIYGSTTFLFTGDAESESESEMLEYDLSADVLKVGHHGSYTSTTEAFLDAVDPGIAVISLAEDNSYGHPHRETLDKLNARNIDVYRTDERGTIIMVTDGAKIYLKE